MIDIRPIAAPAPLQLGYIPGRSRRLVLSFAGVGLDSEAVPRGEFPRLASCGGENHVLLISDGSRSWMNGAGLVEAVDDVVQRLRAEIQPERVIALGNSMGGSSALIYASHARVDGVLALVPQYSVNRRVMRGGNRWRRYTDRIAAWRFPMVPDLSGKGMDIVILHGGNKFEMLHATRFAQHEDILHRVFPKDGHQLARRLKDANLLDPLVDSFAKGDMAMTTTLLDHAGAIPVAEQIARLARKAQRTARRRAHSAGLQANTTAASPVGKLNEAQHDQL